jgi:hypothetical protein
VSFGRVRTTPLLAYAGTLEAFCRPIPRSLGWRWCEANTPRTLIGRGCVRSARTRPATITATWHPGCFGSLWQRSSWQRMQHHPFASHGKNLQTLEGVAATRQMICRWEWTGLQEVHPDLPTCWRQQPPQLFWPTHARFYRYSFAASFTLFIKCEAIAAE